MANNIDFIEAYNSVNGDNTALINTAAGTNINYVMPPEDEYLKSNSEKDAEVNKQAYEMYKQLHEYNTKSRLLDRHTGVSIEDYALSATALEEAGRLVSQEYEFIDPSGTIITNPFTKPLETKTPNQIAEEKNYYVENGKKMPLALIDKSYITGYDKVLMLQQDPNGDVYWRTPEKR